MVGGILICAGCTDSGSTAQQASRKPQRAPEGIIVAMGDSLSEGFQVNREESYPSLLEKKLQKDGFNYKVINAGISGETSRGALERLDWLLSVHPDIVILETGANDGLRGLPVAAMRQNIGAIVSRLKSEKVVVVLAGMRMVWNLGADYTRAFEKVYSDIAKSQTVIFMPFFLKDVAERPALNQSDGIHPNARGYRKVVENLYPYVLEAIHTLRKSKP
jgi:acyl-CoA thioesterase-1